MKKGEKDEKDEKDRRVINGNKEGFFFFLKPAPQETAHHLLNTFDQE